MEFTPFQKTTIEALDDCRGSVKHCAKNAIRHLEKAWEIRNIDLEMAIFRGITAEEEAASAIFHCLKNYRYKNSEKLLFNKHTYKLGLYPFLQGIGRFLGDQLTQENSPFDKFQIRHTEQAGRRAIELLLNMPAHDLTARPIPPLHFTVSYPETGEVCTFESNFKALIEGAGFDDSLKYIKARAAQRNKLLYAESSGRPKVEGNIEGYLEDQKKKVMVYLIIMLMIDPWEKEEGASLFVQQALDSYLLLLQRIAAHEIHQPNNPI
jgi:hypothetical protein